MDDLATGTTRLTLRAIRVVDGVVDPDDLAIAARLVIAYDTAVLGEPDSGASDVEGMLSLPTVDHEATCLVLVGEEPVGFVWLEDDRVGRDTFLEVYATPGPHAAAVRDLGFRRGLEAARRHRDSAPEPGPWTVRAGAWTADEDYAAAMTAHGFTPSRRFYRMRIESTSPMVPPQAPALPDRVRIECSDDEETRRRIWAVDNEAFVAHYNFVPREWDEWWAFMSAGSSRDPGGWWLLTVDGQDAGICLLDESRAELGDGYVAILGVRKEFRGRGLAKLLLRRAFVHYRDLGRAGTQLGVDAENTTGAVRLYESVGMSSTRTVQAYSLELT